MCTSSSPSENGNSFNHANLLKHLWKCRDFELNLLWQRSIFLGVFLTLVYTGYALLWGNNFDVLVENLRFNAIGSVLSLIGISISLLWIAMMRASKAWYEVYESAISALIKNDTVNNEMLAKGFGVEVIDGFSEEFNGKKRNAEEAPFLKSLIGFSLAKGPYSPSRILILMGTLSLFGFMITLGFHGWLLLQYVDFGSIVKFFTSTWGKLCISIGGTAFVTFLLSKIFHHCLRSNRLQCLMSLKPQDKTEDKTENQNN